MPMQAVGAGLERCRSCVLFVSDGENLMQLMIVGRHSTSTLPDDPSEMRDSDVG